MRHLLATLAVMTSAACAAPDGAASGGVVDSVVPSDTALARFRDGLDTVHALHGGAETRDALVRRFVERLAAADTAGVAPLLLTRAEFSWLYYPTLPEARPPYDLAPGLMWFMLEGGSARGWRRALEEYGGGALRFLDHRCEGEPRDYGGNRIHPLCLARWTNASGDTVEGRLFGPILERDGVFKFVSLANRL